MRLPFVLVTQWRHHLKLLHDVFLSATLIHAIEPVFHPPPHRAVVAQTPEPLAERAPRPLVEGAPGELVEGAPGPLVDGAPGPLVVGALGALVVGALGPQPARHVVVWIVEERTFCEHKM